MEYSKKEVNLNMRLLSRPLFIIFIVSILGNGLMLLNDGLYWDDWCIYNHSFEDIKNLSVDAGVYYTGISHIHSFLNSFPNPAFIYHWITFGLVTVTCFMFYKVLLELHSYISRESALVIAIIYASLPYNSARITMICFPYTLCLFLFVNGIYFYIRSIKNKSVFLRITALVFFLYSFSTNSILILYLIIIPIYVYTVMQGDWKKAISSFMKIGDFLLIPFVFTVFKIFYLMPSTNGLHSSSDYYNITPDKLFALPTIFLTTVIESFLGGLSLFYNAIEHSIIILVFFGISLLLFHRLFKKNILTFKTAFTNYGLLFWGIILFLFGIAAYILIGKTPAFLSFDTRHQLLIGFGVAFIAYYLLIKIIAPYYQRPIFIILISMGITVNTNSQVVLLRDWMKQESLLAHLRSFPPAALCKTVIVEDGTISYNQDKIHYDFYVWSGLYRNVWGETGKGFVDTDKLKGLTFSKCDQAKDYFEVKRKISDVGYFNLRGFHPSDSCSFLRVDQTERRLSEIPAIFKLIGLYYFNRNTFKNTIADYTHVSLIPASK